MLWQLLFSRPSRLRLLNEANGGQVIIPLRWLIIAFRLVTVAAVAAVLAACLVWPFLSEVQANTARISKQQTITRCWDRILYNAVKLRPPRAVLTAQAQRCVTLEGRLESGKP